MPDKQSAGADLASRSVSGFALSISTSLALESLFTYRQTPYDPEREIPQHVDVNKYSEIWINLSTLFRNMVASMKVEALHHTTEHEFKTALEVEIDVINSLFQIEGNGVCKPHYYFCTYKSLEKKKSSGVMLREDKTDAQKFYRYKHDKTLELLAKASDEYREFDSSIRPNTGRPNAMIMTHYPYDLLSYRNFGRLDLLESNTGKLKARNQWSSKYYPVGDKDLSILPFQEKLLFVFGDRIQIQPNLMKLRQLILDIAKTRQWTGATTESKVMLDLELSIKEPMVFQFLKRL